jgi:ABC-type transport system involved in multi-copper enzyme maturation permease subunit
VNAFLALAWNGFREARRNRVTSAVVAFAFALLLSSYLVLEVTVITFSRVLVDLGLGAMAMMGVFLAIYLSAGVIPREIERRTLFLVVTRPMSRSTFLAARLAGNLITLGVLLLTMTAVYALQLRLFDVEFTFTQAAAIAGLYGELVLLSAVGFLLSSFSGTLVSALVTTGVFFAGHLCGDIYHFASRAKDPWLQSLGKALYYCLPNLERLNFRPHATHGLAVGVAELGTSLLYALAWSVGLLSLAAALFQRRDFK